MYETFASYLQSLYSYVFLSVGSSKALMNDDLAASCDMISYSNQGGYFNIELADQWNPNSHYNNNKAHKHLNQKIPYIRQDCLYIKTGP